MTLKKYFFMLLAVDFSINKLVFEEHLEKFWYEWGYCTVYFLGKWRLIYGILCSFTMCIINSTHVPSLICPSLNIIRDFWLLQYLVYGICFHFINRIYELNGNLSAKNIFHQFEALFDKKVVYYTLIFYELFCFE